MVGTPVGDAELHGVGAQIASQSRDKWPFAVADASREIERHLGSSDVVRAAAARINQIAHEHGCDAIVGASPMGSVLAGAAVSASPNGLRLFVPTDTHPKVLAVETLLASGVQMLQAMRGAHAAHAD